MWDKLKKLTAFLVAFTCALTPSVQAQIPFPVSPEPGGFLKISSDLQVPQDLGTIQAEHQSGPEKPFIFFIQDAHAIVDAQHHIQQLIEYLQKNYGVNLVALEGGKGKLDPTLFRTFPDPFVKKKILEEYLKRGELTGAQMAAIFSGEHSEADFVGIEDWNLYEENYRAYLAAQQNKEKIVRILKQKQSVLDEKRKKIFSPELNELHEKVENFRNEKGNLTELLKYLAQGRQILPPDLLRSRTPQLFLLMEAVRSESSNPSESLDASVRQMAAAFKWKYISKMSSEAVQRFNLNYQKYVTGQMDTAGFLKTMTELGKTVGVKIKLTASMRQMLGQAETVSMIKGTKLFEELENYLKKLEAKLSETPEQKKLIRQYRFLRLLNDLANLELNKEQWEKIKAFSVEHGADRNFLNAKRSTLSAHFAFYQLAEQRDEAFRKNLKRLLAKRKAKSAIVIAGGFHAQGFQEMLRSEGYSYALITPGIQSLEGREVYPEVMKGNFSYKSYLKSTYYDAFVRHSSLALAGEWNEPDFRRNLKNWRDEVIRYLAQKGRIEKAGDYTRYIDLLIKAYHEKYGNLRDGKSITKEEILKAMESEFQSLAQRAGNQFLSRFESQFKYFSAGLKNLASKNQLSVKNISALIDHSGHIQPSSLVQVPVLFPGVLKINTDVSMIEQKESGEIIMPEFRASQHPSRSEARREERLKKIGKFFDGKSSMTDQRTQRSSIENPVIGYREMNPATFFSQNDVGSKPAENPSTFLKSTNGIGARNNGKLGHLNGNSRNFRGSSSASSAGIFVPDSQTGLNGVTDIFSNSGNSVPLRNASGNGGALGNITEILSPPNQNGELHVASPTTKDNLRGRTGQEEVLTNLHKALPTLTPPERTARAERLSIKPASRSEVGGNQNLQQVFKIAEGDFGVTKDAAERPAVEFPMMVRNNEDFARHGMAQLDVAAPLADREIPASGQNFDKITAGNSGKLHDGKILEGEINNRSPFGRTNFVRVGREIKSDGFSNVPKSLSSAPALRPTASESWDGRNKVTVGASPENNLKFQFIPPFDAKNTRNLNPSQASVNPPVSSEVRGQKESGARLPYSASPVPQTSLTPKKNLAESGINVNTKLETLRSEVRSSALILEKALETITNLENELQEKWANDSGTPELKQSFEAMRKNIEALSIQFRTDPNANLNYLRNHEKTETLPQVLVKAREVLVKIINIPQAQVLFLPAKDLEAWLVVFGDKHLNLKLVKGEWDKKVGLSWRAPAGVHYTVYHETSLPLPLAYELKILPTPQRLIIIREPRVFSELNPVQSLAHEGAHFLQSFKALYAANYLEDYLIEGMQRLEEIRILMQLLPQLPLSFDLSSDRENFEEIVGRLKEGTLSENDPLWDRVFPNPYEQEYKFVRMLEQRIGNREPLYAMYRDGNNQPLQEALGASFYEMLGRFFEQWKWRYSSGNLTLFTSDLNFEILSLMLEHQKNDQVLARFLQMISPMTKVFDEVGIGRETRAASAFIAFKEYVIPVKQVIDEFVNTDMSNEEFENRLRQTFTPRSEVRNGAIAYSDPSADFSGIDLNHFIYAVSRLAERNLVEKRNQNGKLAGGNFKPLLKKLRLRDKGAGKENQEKNYQNIFEKLATNGLTAEIADVIANGSYEDPRLLVTVIGQNSNPRIQGVQEAVANALDALREFPIGQFGKGVKQIIDWLEQPGDRIDVFTAQNGAAYQLTILYAPDKQNYIQIKRIPAEIFQQAAGDSATQGTVVQVTVKDTIPLNDQNLDDRHRHSQEAIIQSIQNTFPYIPSVEITTQLGNEPASIINGFKRKQTLVPARQESATKGEGRIRVTVNDHTIKIIDNGIGMNAEVLSRMFVPKEGTHRPPLLDEKELQEELNQKVKLVYDSSLPDRVSFARNGRVAFSVSLPEDLPHEIVKDAAVKGGLMIEFGNILQVPESWDRVIPDSNFQRAVQHVISEIVNPSQPSAGQKAQLTTEQKVLFINTLVLGLEGLVQGNDNNAHRVKAIRAFAQKVLAKSIEELRGQGFVILPHSKEFENLALPVGRKAFYLNEFLFDWRGEISLREIGAETVPPSIITLGGDKHIPLVVAPFRPESIRPFAEIDLSAEKWRGGDYQFPIIKTDRFIAIPEEFGKRLLELAKKRTRGLSPVEQGEFLSLLERVHILTAEEVVTAYETSKPKENLVLMPEVAQVSSGEFDAEAINRFLVKPPFETQPSAAQVPADANQKLILLADGRLAEAGTGRIVQSEIEVTSLEALSNNYYRFTTIDGTGIGKLKNHSFEIELLAPKTQGTVLVSPDKKFYFIQTTTGTVAGVTEVESGTKYWLRSDFSPLLPPDTLRKFSDLKFTPDGKTLTYLEKSEKGFSNLVIVDLAAKKIKRRISVPHHPDSDISYSHSPFANLAFLKIKIGPTFFLVMVDLDTGNLIVDPNSRPIKKLRTDSSGTYTALINDQNQMFIYLNKKKEFLKGPDGQPLPVSFVETYWEKGKTHFRMYDEKDGEYHFDEEGNISEASRFLGGYFESYDANERYEVHSENLSLISTTLDPLQRLDKKGAYKHPKFDLFIDHSNSNQPVAVDPKTGNKFPFQGEILNFSSPRGLIDYYSNGFLVTQQAFGSVKRRKAFADASRKWMIAPNTEGDNFFRDPDIYLLFRFSIVGKEESAVPIKPSQYPSVSHDGKYFVFSNPKTGDVVYWDPQKHEAPVFVPFKRRAFSETKPEDAPNRFVNHLTKNEVLDTKFFQKLEGAERLYKDVVSYRDASGRLLYILDQKSGEKLITALFDAIDIVARNGRLVVLSRLDKPEQMLLDMETGQIYRNWKKITLSASGRYSIHEREGAIFYIDHSEENPGARLIISSSEPFIEYHVDDHADAVIHRNPVTGKYSIFNLAQRMHDFEDADHIEIDSSGTVAVIKDSQTNLGRFVILLNEAGAVNYQSLRSEKIFVSSDADSVYITDGEYVLVQYSKKDGHRIKSFAVENPFLIEGVPRFWEYYDAAKKKIFDGNSLMFLDIESASYAKNPPTSAQRRDLELHGEILTASWPLGKNEKKRIIRDLRTKDTLSVTVESERWESLENGRVFYSDFEPLILVINLNRNEHTVMSSIWVNQNKFLLGIEQLQDKREKPAVDLIDSEGRSVEISAQIPQGFEPVDTNGRYFVFYNEKTGEFLYLDPEAAMGRQNEISSGELSEKEWEAIEHWKKTVFSKRNEFIAQARTRTRGLLAGIPEEFRSSVEITVKTAVEKFYQDLEKEINQRYQEAVDGKEPDFTIPLAPFRIFDTQIVPFLESLRSFLDLRASDLHQENPQIARSFYQNLFSALFSLLSSSEVKLPADDLTSFFEVFSLGWQLQVAQPQLAQHQIADAKLIHLFLEALDLTGNLAMEEKMKITGFLSYVSSKGLNEHQILTRQLRKLLRLEAGAPLPGQDKLNPVLGLLSKLRESFGPKIDLDTLKAGVEDPEKYRDRLGDAFPFVIFLSTDVEPVRTAVPAESQIPAGIDIPLPEGGLEISRIAKLEQSRKKSGPDDIVMTMDYLEQAIRENRLPPASEALEAELRNNVQRQREPGADKAEIAQNSRDKTRDKNGELTVDFYIRTNAQGEKESVEEARDNGEGAEQEVALIIPKSTKADANQLEQSGFFGTGKYTIANGVERVEYLTRNQQQAYFLEYTVFRNKAGEVTSVRLTRMRKVNDPSVPLGVSARRIKRVATTIPELDQMLAQRSWKTFAGLSQDEHFKIFFIDHEGRKQPLVVDHEVLSSIPFIAKKPREEKETHFGEMRLIETKGMPSQIIDKAGLRISKIPDAYLKWIPQSLRKYIEEFGINLQIPLPQIGGRSGFEQDSYYLVQIQKYVAIEFLKALAHKMLSIPNGKNPHPFVFGNFPLDWETSRDYWSAINPHWSEEDRSIVSLAAKINQGHYERITEEELTALASEEKGVNIKSAVEKLVVLLEVPAGKDANKKTSMLARRLAVQNQTDPAGAGRQMRMLHFDSRNIADPNDIPNFSAKMSQAQFLLQGNKQMAHWQDFVTNPETDQEKEFLELAEQIAGLFGMKKVFLVGADRKTGEEFITPGVFIGDAVLFSRNLAKELGKTNLERGFIDKGTYVIVHELGHLIEKYIRSGVTQLQPGEIYAAHEDSSKFTHNKGLFAFCLKLVSAASLAHHSPARSEVRTQQDSKINQHYAGILTSQIFRGKDNKSYRLRNNGFGFVIYEESQPNQIVGNFDLGVNEKHGELVLPVGVAMRVRGLELYSQILSVLAKNSPRNKRVILRGVIREMRTLVQLVADLQSKKYAVSEEAEGIVKKYLVQIQNRTYRDNSSYATIEAPKPVRREQNLLIKTLGDAFKKGYQPAPEVLKGTFLGQRKINFSENLRLYVHPDTQEIILESILEPTEMISPVSARSEARGELQIHKNLGEKRKNVVGRISGDASWSGELNRSGSRMILLGLRKLSIFRSSWFPPVIDFKRQPDQTKVDNNAGSERNQIETLGSNRPTEDQSSQDHRSGVQRPLLDRLQLSAIQFFHRLLRLPLIYILVNYFIHIINIAFNLKIPSQTDETATHAASVKPGISSARSEVRILEDPNFPANTDARREFRKEIQQLVVNGTKDRNPKWEKVHEEILAKVDLEKATNISQLPILEAVREEIKALFNAARNSREEEIYRKVLKAIDPVIWKLFEPSVRFQGDPLSFLLLKPLGEENARSEVRSYEIGSAEKPIQNFKQFADALRDQGIISASDYGQRKIPQAAQQTIISIYFTNVPEVLTVAQAYQRLKELKASKAASGIKITLRDSGIKIRRRATETPPAEPGQPQSSRPRLRFLTGGREEWDRLKNKFLDERQPEAVQRHKILEGTRGVENQIKKWLDINGKNREWIFYLIRNNSTNELRVVFDLLGEGTGEGTGPYGLGASAPHIYSRAMAERLLSNGEEIVADGHTHPLNSRFKNGVSLSDTDFHLTYPQSTLIYMPGISSSSFVETTGLMSEIDTWDENRVSDLIKQGWTEYKVWYGGRQSQYDQKYSGFYWRHFVRPFNPRNFQPRSEVRIKTMGTGQKETNVFKSIFPSVEEMLNQIQEKGINTVLANGKEKGNSVADRLKGKIAGNLREVITEGAKFSTADGLIVWLFSDLFETKVRQVVEPVLKLGFLQDVDINAMIWRIRGVAIREMQTALNEQGSLPLENNPRIEPSQIQALDAQLNAGIERLKNIMKKIPLVINNPETEAEAKIVAEVLADFLGLIERLDILKKGNQNINLKLKMPVTPHRLTEDPNRTIEAVQRQGRALGEPPVYAFTSPLGISRELSEAIKMVFVEIRKLPTPQMQKLAYKAFLLLLFRFSDMTTEQIQRLHDPEKLKKFLEGDSDFHIIAGGFQIGTDGSIGLFSQGFIKAIQAVKQAA